jgi:hypothetical protein
MDFTCPNCKSTLYVQCENYETVTIWSTLDCPNCKSLLIWTENKVIKDFHKYINEVDASWPEDGKGCSFIECKKE